MLSWSIWCFATHPGVQEKAYNELIEHFGHSDTEFYTGKIKELKYLDQCVKEVLRLRPSVPAILRFIHNEIEMGGRTIPAKTSVSIPIVMIHQNPTVNIY
jgi:cytochrome P450 family 4